MPKVSIIVPLYNAAENLSRCVSTLRSQSLADCEIILVDDGSTDGSEFICDNVAIYDQRIKVIHQDNKGSTAARKVGIKLANSKYVTFVDSDDWVEEDLCALLYDAAEKSGADVVIGEHYLDVEGASKRQQSIFSSGFYDRNDMEKLIFPHLFHNDFNSEWGMYPYLCGKLFIKKRLLPCLERADDGISLGDDVCVTFPYVLNCRSMAIIDKPLYHYVQRGDSQSQGKMHPVALRKMCRIYQLVMETLREQNLEEEYAGQFRRYMLTTMLVPRSPWLLSNVLKDEEMFPFFKFPRDSRVIIYGAGVFGRALYYFLEESNFAKVMLWLDARAFKLRGEGVPVCALDEIMCWPEYDYVVISIINKNITKVVKKDLISAGVEGQKIRFLDENEICSDAVWRMFGIDA